MSQLSHQMGHGATFTKYEHDVNATLGGDSDGRSPSLPATSTSLNITVSPKPAPDGRLWQEILDNIKKDLDKRTCITLSLTTAATIAAAAVSQRRELRDASSRAQVDVVVFTCSHQFPKYYFDDVIIPEFQQRMGDLTLSLPETTKLLMGYYSNGEGFLPTACPSCVYNFLRKEQLQAEDFKNVEYAKAKPWEI